MQEPGLLASGMIRTRRTLMIYSVLDNLLHFPEVLHEYDMSRLGVAHIVRYIRNSVTSNICYDRHNLDLMFVVMIGCARTSTSKSHPEHIWTRPVSRKSHPGMEESEDC